MKKFSVYLLMIFLLILIGGPAAQAQDDMYIVQGNLLNLPIYSHGGGHTTWGPNWFRIWEPWVPPGETNDIGYHGISVDNKYDPHLIHERRGMPLNFGYGWWACAENWTSPPSGQWGNKNQEVENFYTAGKTFDVFLYNQDFRNSIREICPSVYPENIKIYRRYDKPTAFIDDNELSFFVAYYGDARFETVDDLPSHTLAETEWTHPLGLTFHQENYVYENQDYRDIVIADITITNTGDCNARIPGLEKPGQVLENVWLGAATLIAHTDRFHEFNGNRYNGSQDHLLDYDPSTRTTWVWDGDASDVPGDDQFDPRGGPTGQSELNTGEFLGTQIFGHRFLHVSGPDGIDDPSQPTTFRYEMYTRFPNPHEDGESDMLKHYNWLSGSDGNAPFAEGFADDPYQTQSAGEPEYFSIYGIGPYTLQPNEHIRVVLCYAAASIPEPEAIELGYKVVNDQMSLQDAKTRIYTGGKELLMENLDRGKAIFNNGFSVPEGFPPNPPTNLKMIAGNGRNTLSWDSSAGAVEYRVYMASGGIVGGRVYRQIYSGPHTEFIHDNLIAGFSYYYYVTAVGSNGQESSHIANRSDLAVVPAEGPNRSASWADSVLVVPNPYNAKGGTYLGDQPHGTTGFNYDGGLREINSIKFVNLPAFCQIRIFNMMGDLIKTLDHDSETSTERWYPMLNEYNQFPASGIYFYTIQVYQGQFAGTVGKGKFIIIR